MDALLAIGAVILVIWFIAKVTAKRLPPEHEDYRTQETSPSPSAVRSRATQPAATGIRPPPKRVRAFGPHTFRAEDVRLDDPLFRSALEALEAGESVFITGKAGTGKSTLLRYFRETTPKSVVVFAPTGVAALNVGGQTIHSFFRLPPRDFVDPDTMTPPRGRSYLLMSKLETLVIDEVSMVRAEILECVDRLLRMARSRPTEPFGGVQLVLIGDPFQLPPAVKDRAVRQHFARCYGGPWFFLSPALRQAGLRLIELHKSYRQNDPVFLDVLNSVRENRLDPEKMAVLQRLVQPREQAFSGEPFVTTTPTNAVAQDINGSLLNELPGPEVVFHGDFAGDMGGGPGKLPSALPTDDPVVLKQGAQVMLVRNDAQRRWVNGSIGVVSGDPHESVQVNLYGNIYRVDRCTWEKIEYTYDTVERKILPQVVGSFTQYPLKLGWAFTIHKVQGLTLDRLYLDLAAGAFAHGQTYTALSRCRSLDGLALSREIRESDIILDPDLLAFRQAFRT